MKIALFDPYVGKFTTDMQEWWESQGHEVQRQTYYNPQLAEWADVIWFDTTDNNLCSATNPGAAIMDDTANYQPWDLHHMDLSNKRVIVRAIDIEVWQGHQNAAIWDVVDDLIFIAPHIREIANEHELPGRKEDLRVHTIPCAVDLNRWSFKQRESGFNIAVVAERWTSKGTAEILQIAYKLKQIDPRYKITWLGKRSDYPWEHEYRDEFVTHHDVNIEFINVVDDVNEFLEDKNYLLSCSHKEAFAYNIAEAAAKGIRPIVHRFYGCDDLWGDSGWVWSGIDEAIDMITDGEYDSLSYRQYLLDHGYTLPQMMEKFDAIINNKEK